LSNQKPITFCEKPTVSDATKIVQEAIASRKMLILVGSCRVNYMGRASSKLESGERVLIIKEDGSILVHRPKGYEPVNWQPPGCFFHTYKKKSEEILVVKAIRKKPYEILTIFYDKIYLISILSLTDKGEFSLYASENDMQKAILIQPNLIEEGFKPITHEKRVKSGFIDVYGIDNKGRSVVIEIKRRTARKEDVLQLEKYLESLKSIKNQEIRGILVAPQIAKGVQITLESLGLDFKQLTPKKCAEIIKNRETKILADYY
jgi:RecB family endonuclease NucS